MEKGIIINVIQGPEPKVSKIWDICQDALDWLGGLQPLSLIGRRNIIGRILCRLLLTDKSHNYV